MTNRDLGLRRYKQYQRKSQTWTRDMNEAYITLGLRAIPHDNSDIRPPTGILCEHAPINLCRVLFMLENTL